MEKWDVIAKQARESHTNAAWVRLTTQNRDVFISEYSAKHLDEIVRQLISDPKSVYFDSEVWEVIIKAARHNWDLGIGVKVAEHCAASTSPTLLILAAQLLMDAGQTGRARTFSQRATKLAAITESHLAQLHLIIGLSYVEENKPHHAKRHLQLVDQYLAKSTIEDAARAEITLGLARGRFFIGDYLAAAQAFLNSYELFLQTGDMEAAAKGLFNAAASFHNSGEGHHQKAFSLVATCKRLSETHNLSGPLAHCYAFYGTDAHQRGYYSAAQEHFRKALEFLPSSDRAFRRLHIVSMLALTNLRLGRIQSARKYAHLTTELAEKDETKWFRSRYSCLEAELAWTEGEFKQSQDILAAIVADMPNYQITTLEQLAVIERVQTQSAYLGASQLNFKPKINDKLRENTVNWLQYLNSENDLLITRCEYSEALTRAEAISKKAQRYGALYIEQIALQQIIQASFGLSKDTTTLQRNIERFENSVSRQSETPLLAYVDISLAALAYRNGQWTKCLDYLQHALKLKRLANIDRFLITAWLTTAGGGSPRLERAEEVAYVSRMTRIFFDPSVCWLNESDIAVSEHYHVSLQKFPIIRQVLQYLAQKPLQTATYEELLEAVWHESNQTQGWEQKIRNTVVRIRELIPYTMMPLIGVGDHEIKIFAEAIAVRLNTKALAADSYAEALLKLLREGPLSTIQLSNRINISQATTKRLLKKLADDHPLTISKIGRHVVYYVPKESKAPKTSAETRTH